MTLSLSADSMLKPEQLGPANTSNTHTFPQVTIPGQPGGLPTEVSLIAMLSPGTGSKLFYATLARQRAHTEFVDELDEPSVKLGGTDFNKGDATALYSFGVGPHGHPFHRHAGHRIFCAISGSGGAQLRFSATTPDELAADPSNFVRGLQFVNIPPDCLFTVRFGGETWHQFMPLDGTGRHPAFFALSSHTNELGGALSAELRDKVMANEADIPSLTEVLPDEVYSLMISHPGFPGQVPTTVLWLDTPPGGLLQRVCSVARSGLGRLCAAATQLRGAQPGFAIRNESLGPVQFSNRIPGGSLLEGQLPMQQWDHEDHFYLVGRAPGAHSATEMLARLLEGFVRHNPRGVARLMQIRNTLVRPLGLRTATLGCPVSSLLSGKCDRLFAETFPVLAQQVNAADTEAQVILGADDRHLQFRTAVSVRLLPSGHVQMAMSTRVFCKNWFGRFYMATISAVHRRYIAPTMLRDAAASVLGAAPNRSAPLGSGVVNA